MFARIFDSLFNWLLAAKGLAIIGAPTRVDIFAPDGSPTEDLLAEVNTALDYSIIDEQLARELELLGEEAVVEEVVVPELGPKKRPVIMVSFSLGGRPKRSRWIVMDRERQPFRVAVGRQDLAGFLVQTSEIV